MLITNKISNNFKIIIRKRANEIPIYIIYMNRDIVHKWSCCERESGIFRLWEINKGKVTKASEY